MINVEKVKLEKYLKKTGWNKIGNSCLEKEKTFSVWEIKDQDEMYHLVVSEEEIIDENHLNVEILPVLSHFASCNTENILNEINNA